MTAAKVVWVDRRTVNASRPGESERLHTPQKLYTSDNRLSVSVLSRASRGSLSYCTV